VLPADYRHSRTAGAFNPAPASRLPRERGLLYRRDAGPQETMSQALGHARDGSTFPIHSCAYRLPAHDEGTAATVRLMIDKATGRGMEAQAHGSEGAQHPQVRDFALQATAGCLDRDDWGQAQAIYRAVKDKIRFRGEYGETVQTPLLTLQWQAGDCDDFATLLCALLLSIGIPSRIQTIAVPGHKDFGHVFCVVGVRQRGQVVAWPPLDPTVPGTAAGWQPPNAIRRKFWGGDELGSAVANRGPAGTQRRSQTMQGYRFDANIPEPRYGMGSFFGRLKKAAIGAGEGFIIGGPAGAVAGGARGAIARRAKFVPAQSMQGYVFTGMPLAMRHYAATPPPPLIPTDPTWHGRDKIYLGDAGGALDFMDNLSTTQKVVAGVAGVALLLALTQ
jgi:transglutaminase superfamily protein